MLVEHLQHSNKHERWYPTLERFVKFYHMAEQVCFYIHYVFPQNQYEIAQKWEDMVNHYDKDKFKLNKLYQESLLNIKESNMNEEIFSFLGILDFMRRGGQEHLARLNGLNHDFFSFELIVKVALS